MVASSKAAKDAEEAGDIDGALIHLREMDEAEQELRAANEAVVLPVDFSRNLAAFDGGE
jgi:hypothetical protein